MHERLGLSWDIIPALRQSYYERYGTTLRGLQIHHDVDADDYLAYVHDLPLDKYLQPAPRLRDLLLDLPVRCWVFTNADAGHALRVLTRLGCEMCFDGIIDVRALKFVCKPEEEAYRRALEIVGEAEPHPCILFDDSMANLLGAKQFGLTTVLVGNSQKVKPGIDFVVKDLLELPEVLPELWLD